MPARRCSCAVDVVVRRDVIDHARRGLVGLASSILFSITVAGCSRSHGPSSDAAAEAHRVVSLSPSTTETMFAIHANDRLVGRSRYCDYPPEALALPSVGGYTDPSFEAILALHPDLVIGARGPAGPPLEERLAAHARTFFPETETLEQIDAMVLGVGARVGHADDAKALVAAMHAREDAVATAVKDLPRPRVLLVYGLTPTVVAGPGSFADVVIARAGGVNVMTAGGPYPTIGMEQVLALDPDVVLDAAMQEAHSVERISKDAAGWKSTRAVTNGKVVALDDETVLRPGPRVGDAIATIARAIHPEAEIP